MERAASLPRPPTRRKPLGDGTHQANSSFHSPRSAKGRKMSTSSTPSALPHHESLNPNGPLTVRNITGSPENKRLSNLTNEDFDSKRNSQVSTTSTNASGRGRRRKTHIGPWELGSDVGKGGIGRVRKVRHSATGQQAAAKIIPKKLAETARAESLANLVERSRRPSSAAFGHVMPYGIEREVIIMKLLQHPNVVKLYDVWENKSELYLIMEYVDGGELFDFITDNEFIQEDETVYLFRQMLAALLHCHRLGIHHRDLKPENILLDRDCLKVKLADFGMAALQPKGRNLTTPCGSIHYAAPEVFDKKYDGSKIDVWSLGIILFVMLTGSPPFYYDPEIYEGNMRAWYDILLHGDIEMPSNLSAEAQDLLWKMLKPDPKKRISLEGAWNHPFIHKYEREWAEPPSSGDLQNWIGATPVISEWRVKTPNDIDRELLRNLQTLWHSEKEEVLVERLISAEPNHEKYFYYALTKAREEQLENYAAGPETLAYSTSDYQHLRPHSSAANIPPVPRAGSRLSARTKSQFSILNDEHLQSRSSIMEAPPSERSYDPYRASRDTITRREDIHTSVTIHRDASKHSRKHSGTQSLRHPPSLRIEALKKEQRRISTVSSSTSLRLSSTSTRSRLTNSRRSMSRSSLASSDLTTSSPVVFKPATKHKRPVNFSHLRKSSTVSALDAAREIRDLITTPQKRLHKAKHLTPDIRDPLSSPILYGDNPVRSKKESERLATARPHERRGQTASQVIDTEARKVSTELEKYCEEVFNRSSGSSSHRTSATTSQAPCNTPPSSVSNRGSSNSAQIVTTPSGSKRALPELPGETPITYAARELAETRNRLAARYAADPSANNQTYNEVLAHLDALLKKPVSSANVKRTMSLPEPRYSTYFSDLPAISEEGRTLEHEISHLSIDVADSRAGTVEPGKKAAGNAPWGQNSAATIRMIDASSPPRPAPLNIRKTSTAATSTPSLDLKGGTTRSQSAFGQTQQKNDRATAIGSPVALSSFAEQPDKAETSHGSEEQAQPKKRAWWKIIKTPESEASLPGALKKWDSLDEQVKSPLATEFERSSKRASDPGSRNVLMSGALQAEQSPSLSGKRPGFLKFFRRTPKSYNDDNYPLRRGTENEPSTPSTQTTFCASDRTRSVFRQTGKDHAIEDNERTDPRGLGVQQNWLARFLHIKPASRVLCLETTRGRARGEIVRLLDNWRVHGLQDVIVDKPRNLIFGRLDAVNALGLKEVDFVIELFVVLERGRRKGLSIARWTQRKGAASSFRRVVQEVEARFESRRLLVRDKAMRKEMEGVLAGELGR